MVNMGWITKGWKKECKRRRRMEKIDKKENIRMRIRGEKWARNGKYGK